MKIRSIPMASTLRSIALLAALLTVAGCYADETVGSYGAEGKLWHLKEVDSQAFTAKATLSVTGGVLSGNAPCNSYSATITSPYPWFETGPVRVTRRACPDLAAEVRFFEALNAMTLVEVLGDTLILRTPEGREMVFKADG